MKSIIFPPYWWMFLVGPDDPILLVKENEVARVEFSFRFEPRSLRPFGRIGLRRKRGLESWLADAHGHGLDGSILLRPIEGHRPSDGETTVARLRELFELLSMGSKA